MRDQFNRRKFLKTTTKAGLGIAFGGAALSSSADQPLPALEAYPYKLEKLDKVRIGMVGVGGMGASHVSNFLKIEGCEIVAVCDIMESRVERAQKMAIDAGFKKPEGYSKGEYDYKRMCERDDIDLVFTATPWKWHVPVCLEAMNSGKHAATEVPAALTISDCWALIETSENTGKHCIMMENCNYDRDEMIILNMVKKGVFGDLLHARCGYLHDLRAVKHDMNGEGVWRRDWSKKRNGDLYPTHGLGPVAQCMDINRGNYFDYLVSFSTKSRGLSKYAVKTFGHEIQKMKDEAAANADADLKAKEEIEKMNSADALIFQTEKQLKEYGDKIPAEKKTPIETAFNSLKEAHKNKDLAAIEASMNELNTAWQAASQDMYAATQEGASAQPGPDGQPEGNDGEASAKDDEVTDVDFEEVKDDK